MDGPIWTLTLPVVGFWFSFGNVYWIVAVVGGLTVTATTFGPVQFFLPSFARQDGMVD